MKSEKITRLLVVAATIFVVGACAKKSEDNGGGGTIPGDIGFEVPQAAKLTPEQKTHFTDRMKALNGPVYSSLVWVKPDETSEERQRRLDDRAKLNADQKAALQDVESNCRIVHPTKTETSRPPGQPATGTTVRQDVTAKIESDGRPCAVSASDDSWNETAYRRVDQAAGLVEGQMHGNLAQSSSQTGAAASSSGIKETLMSVGMNGNITYSSKLGLGMVVQIQGAFGLVPTAGGPMKINIDGRMLQVLGEKGAKSESYFHMRMNDAGVDYVLSTYTREADGQPAVHEFYLNGEKISDPGVGTPVPSSIIEPVAARALSLGAVR